MSSDRRGVLDVLRTPGRARNALTFAVVVLAFFTALDLVIFVSPQFGAFYVRNAGILLAIGGSAAIATLGVLYVGRLLPAQEAEPGDADRTRVLDALDALGNFVVLSEIPTRRGAIPYALVGAGGVYLIDVDERGGRVAFDGKSMRVGGRLIDHSRCARLVAHARYLESLIDQVLEKRVRVRPVYAFEHARIPAQRTHAGVSFVSLRDLSELTARSRFVLHPDDVSVVRSLLGSGHHSIVDAARPDIFSTPSPAAQSTAPHTL